MDDTIYRQAAIDAFYEMASDIDHLCTVGDYVHVLETLPSAQLDVPDTNVGDMISRQAAIDYIDAGHLVNPNEPRWSDNEVVNFLKSRPSAQPEQQWIPCSESLPEVGTYVLISKKALNFRSNLPSVCTAHRSCDPRSGKEEWNDMLFGKLDDDKVLAWQPLPEPYKEEER